MANDRQAVKRLKRPLQRVMLGLVRSVTRAHYEEYYYSPRWHPHYALLENALSETIDYIKTEMPHAMIRRDAFEVLEYASGQVANKGLFLEFGVRTGTTIDHISRLHPTETIHGFDSFEGLPANWSGWTQPKGAFGRADVPVVGGNVRLVVGWFDETLPEFLQSHAGDVAFAHIDSDLYSSARTVLTTLAPRITAGSIIVFNEYFNYPNWKEHEYKAFQEFCREHSVDYEYLCWGMYEVAVRILAIGDRS